MGTILFAEDDSLIASGIIYALEQEGFCVKHTKNVASSIALINEPDFDISLGLADLSLPDGTGHEICAELKKRRVPVIFLTAADDEGNVVKALEMGADDYVCKPFRLRELIARIKGAVRRNEEADIFTEEKSHKNIVSIGGEIEINTLKAKVYKNQNEIFLTSLEYRILILLAYNKGIVMPRNMLLDGIWDTAGNFVNDNTLTVYIKRLREKLEDDMQNPKIIKTVRGMGYIIDG